MTAANTKPEQYPDTEAFVYRAHSKQPHDINRVLMEGLLQHQHDADVKRTHLFNGRYENIYLNETHIPQLKALMEEACGYANALLGTSNIKAGYWFNYMPPGSVTIPHRHDDDDELLSAAYYVSVPQDSGDLIIHAKPDQIRIKPEAGMFIFFKPDIVHEVTENLSPHNRLSIGINFGIPSAED